MKTRHLYFLTAVTVILVVAAGALVYVLWATPSVPPNSPPVPVSQGASPVPTSTSPIIATVNYACDAGKTISAVYASGTVQVSLSDGRQLAMPQTVSGSGIRYEQGASTSEDIVFWSEGANAFLSENGMDTYQDCVAGATSAQNNGSNTFTDQGNTFSFRYPSTLAVSGGGVGYTQDWTQNATSMGLILAEIDVPSSTQPNTNFSSAKLTVGTSADPAAVADCLTAVSGYTVAPSSTQVVINGVPFTKFTYGEGGAGNFYDTTSYRALRNSQCYIVEYTIHSTDIGNYPPSAGITAFDQAGMQNTLDGIVQSFAFLGPDQAASASAQSPYVLGVESNGEALAVVPTSRITLDLPSAEYDKNALKIDPSGSLTETFGASAAPGDWVRTFEADATGTSSITIPPKTASGTAYNLTLFVVDPDLAWENGMQVITPQSNDATIHLHKNDRFALELGNLKWTLSFDPSDIVTKVPDSVTTDGYQGVYEATATGTTTFHAIGAPICSPGEACPQFLINVTATLVVE